MFSERVVYVDIETSGGRLTNSKITEIAALRVEHGKVVKEFHSLFNIGKPLPYWITKLTGITDADLADAQSFYDAADELYSVLEGAIFIAHNVRFDYSFIKQELAQAGYEWKPKLLCTVRLSRALYPETKGHSLEKIIARHRITVPNRHRAMDDAKAMMDFVGIAFREKGNEVFQQAVDQQLKRQTLPPNLQEKALDNATTKHGVYIYRDSAGKPLYVGKSVNVRSRLLSHFSDDINTPKEMQLSQKVHDIEVIETDSELEALLLEATLVKELMPVYNRQLRRQNDMTVLLKTVDGNGYFNLSITKLTDFNSISMDDVYGVYRTPGHAKLILLQNIRTFNLCQKLTGIEKGSGPCFLYQLKKCRGACTGKETAAVYNKRLDIAVAKTKLESWPYKGSIKLSVSKDTYLLVNNWRIEGRLTRTGQSSIFHSLTQSFDYDTYKILRAHINKTAFSV